MSLVIWWLRRDLRLADNQALAAAQATGSGVLPVFILDPVLLKSEKSSPKRLAFLFQNLESLQEQLNRRGSQLHIRQGHPVQVLSTLISETNASAIFAEADYSVYARRRDTQIEKFLPLKLTGGPTLFPPEAVLKPDGTPYHTFTPYSRAWKALPFPGAPQPAPERLLTPDGFTSLPVPKPDPRDIPQDFPGGESEASNRLARFVRGLGAPISLYSEGRNMLAEDGTSQLSPYLRFGILSARQAVFAARQAMQNAEDHASKISAETWLNELIWRDFFISILYHFPHVHSSSFQPAMQNIPWQNDPQLFAAWAGGQTGYPVVDAAMRQLSQMGWMHNRARMITASFLTKHLRIDWRWGEKHFMQNLVDGDPAANNGGWQWTAGTGVDAAPYFRIFNPITQGEKFDPQGDYIRRFVPELRKVPVEYLHQVWTMPAQIQQLSGCRLGIDYPFPVVDHATARQEALAMFAASRAK